MLTVFYLGLLLGIADGSLPPTPQSNMISKQLEQVSREFDLNTYTQQWLETCEHINGTQASEDIQVNSSPWIFVHQRRLATALFTLSDCVTSKINIVNITEEIKAAAPRGALDEVFASYCNLVPGIKHCRTPMISALQVCLSHQRDDDLQLIDSAIDGALDFMCFKGGERIAIFLAENGTDCLYDNADRIASCINDTMPQVQSLLQNLQLFNESIFDPVNCE